MKSTCRGKTRATGQVPVMEGFDDLYGVCKEPQQGLERG